MFRHVGVNDTALAVDQWANDAVGPRGIDAGEPINASATQHTAENSFRLVVERVSCGDALCIMAAGASFQYRVASPASLGLERGSRRDVRSQRHERYAQASGEFSRDFDVSDRIGAQAMVDGCRDQCALVFSLQATKHM